MNKDCTHITVILDRSGSMESIRDDTIGGFNTFLNEQKASKGSATLTLIQFDTNNPYEVVHRFKPIGEVPELTRDLFVPRGGTPLLDALGRGIKDLKKNLGDLKKKKRPSKVVMVVVTDGQENSSRVFNKEKIEAMVNKRTENDDWQFVFLSADLAAVTDANAMGFSANSSMLFSLEDGGSQKVWSTLSKRTAMYRSSLAEKVSFEQEDREHPDDPEKKKVEVSQ